VHAGSKVVKLKLKSIDKLRYIPLRHRFGKVYYFSSDDIIAECAAADVPEEIKNVVMKKYGREPLSVRKEIAPEEYLYDYLVGFNPDEDVILDYDEESEKVGRPLKKALGMLKKGDTYSDLEKYLQKSAEYFDKMHKTMSENGWVYHIRVEGLDRFITKVFRPEFVRSPENPNKKTFDIIKVRMDIVSQWDSDRKKYIIENKKSIIEKAIEKIRNDRRFMSFGVDVNYLALTKLMMLNINTLELIFELKKKIRDMEEPIEEGENR
jgi:hypothetical protein